MMTISKEDAGTFPELKTWHNFDRFFKGKFRLFDKLNNAVQWLEESPSTRQIYTEIEADNRNMTLYMDRGFHICNRTGIYAVVQDDRFKVMKYAGLSKPKLGSWSYDDQCYHFKEAPKEVEKIMQKLQKQIEKLQDAGERFNDKLADGAIPESQQWNNPYESKAIAMIDAKTIIKEVFRIE